MYCVVVEVSGVAPPPPPRGSNGGVVVEGRPQPPTLRSDNGDVAVEGCSFSTPLCALRCKVRYCIFDVLRCLLI